MGLDHVESVTYDNVPHGTTTLFAAVDVASGEVITQYKPQHRHQEFLSFLRHPVRPCRPTSTSTSFCDNNATHKHLKVKAWLARRLCYRLHFMLTYASWLNQVERWFGMITQQAIRHGSFLNVRELVRQIDEYVSHYNTLNRPLVWTATADYILAKPECLYKVINGAGHFGTSGRRSGSLNRSETARVVETAEVSCSSAINFWSGMI